jgi:hypothetical protein
MKPKRLSRKELNQMSLMLGIPPLPNPPRQGKPDPFYRKLLGHNLIVLVQQWQMGKLSQEELSEQAIELVQKTRTAEYHKTKGDFYAALNKKETA